MQEKKAEKQRFEVISLGHAIDHQRIPFQNVAF